MALHGKIKVNELTIAGWSARRIDDLLDPDQSSLYICWYIAWEGDPEPLCATLEHRYSDGAASLAAKVLTLAEGGW